MITKNIVLTMKNLCALLALLFLTVPMLNAQTDGAQAVAVADDAAGPKMTFDTYEVDYGVIEQNSDPLRTFNFKNEGNEPLQITNAKGSCGCTVPSYPKEPIFPGESGVIEVRYDTKRIGKFVKRVTLTTNEGGEPTKLTIKGEVLKAPEEPAGLPASSPSILSPNGNN